MPSDTLYLQNINNKDVNRTRLIPSNNKTSSKNPLSNQIKVSIIITAYNRKSYLMNALRSLVSSKITNLELEIIVIKNFIDKKIDEYLSKIKAKSILGKEAPLCNYVYQGIINSTGKYLFFLEDDDLFFPSKIDYVISLMESRQIDYYHNSYIALDENESKINSMAYRTNRMPIVLEKQKRDVARIGRLMKIKGDINLSSICISRNLFLHSKEIIFLKDLPAGPDWFIFYLALQNGFILYFDNKILTKYLIHDSTANTKSDKIEQFVKGRIFLIQKEVKSLLVMLAAFSSPEIKEIIRRRIVTDLLQAEIIGYNPKIMFPEFNKNIGPIGVRRDLFGIIINLIFLLHKVLPDFALWIYANALQKVVFGKSSLR